MKWRKYIIEHTKNTEGRDEYRIYRLYLGFIKIAFKEKIVIYNVYGREHVSVRKKNCIYNTLKDVTDTVNSYITEPTIEYRGYTLERCHDDEWSTKDGDFRIGGMRDSVMRMIDRIIKEKENRDFKEVIEL